MNIRSYKVFNDLLKWEKMNYLYQSALKSAGDNPNEATQAAIDEIAETKEKVELELQRSEIRLIPALFFRKELKVKKLGNPEMEKDYISGIRSMVT